MIPSGMSQLEREIHALLGRPFARRLSPRPARQPVLGARNTVLPGDREGPDPQSSDQPNWWPSVGLRMEHGLLSLDLADLIASPATTGPLVHLSGSLTAYYASGTLLPDSDPARTEPLVGRLALSTLIPPPDWPDGAPGISDQTHPGLAGLGPAAVNYLVQEGLMGGYTQRIFPGRYTGPARAWVQAWVGAGLGPDEIADRLLGWATAPGALGLAVSPEGAYWALACGPGGLIAHRLVSPDVTAPVAAWLRDDNLTGWDADLARAYVLADLRLDPEGEPLILVTGADMTAGPYQEGATPIQSGWHWSASGNLGAIVTEYTVDAGLSSQASMSAQSTIALTWSAGVPSAVLEAGTFSKFRPMVGAHFFWYGSGGEFGRLRHALIWPGNSDCADVAPVVCWYEGEALQTVSYYRARTTYGESTSENTGGVDVWSMPATIADNISSTTRSAGISMIYGGFGLSLPPPAMGGGGTMTEYRALRSARGGFLRGGSGDYMASSWEDYTWRRYCSDVTPWVNQPGGTWCGGTSADPTTYAIDYQWARVEAYQDSQSWTNRAGRNIVIYDISSPDVMWTVGGYTAQSEAHDRHDYVNTNQYYAAKELGVRYYDRNAVRCTVVETKAAWRWYTSWGETMFAPLPWPDSDVRTTSSRSNVDERVGSVRIAGQTIAGSEKTPWTAFEANGSEPVIAALWARVAASGAAIYTAHPSADPAALDWDGPLPNVLGSGHGYALAWVGGI